MWNEYINIMSRQNIDDVYIQSVDQFVNVIPNDFLRTLRDKILENKEDEALDLACQYVVKFFSYISYQQCYHHGHFVYALLERAMSGLDNLEPTRQSN